MERLFYSETENLLFWVAGYVGDNVANIENATNKFLEISKSSKEKICVREITESRRYKNMKLFWTKIDSTPPEAALNISWTMNEWIVG